MALRRGNPAGPGHALGRGPAGAGPGCHHRGAGRADQTFYNHGRPGGRADLGNAGMMAAVRSPATSIAGGRGPSPGTRGRT